MRNKKDLPLTILKSLESFVNLKGDKFETIEPKNDLLMHAIDIEENSKFYFIIEKFQKTQSGKFQLLMSRSPRSENENGNYQTWIEITQLKGQFEAWLHLLDQYDSVNSFFDDPIIKSFKEEYYAEFEIIDDNDSETKPLKVNQILLLDEHLEYIENKIDDFKNEENSTEIEEIKQSVKELRKNITSKSKVWVAKKLATIWAKLAKQGTQFIKEFISDSRKEIVKHSIKGLIEIIKENGQDLLN